MDSGHAGEPVLIDDLSERAARLDGAGAAITAAAAGLTGRSAGPGRFGADAPGRVGEIGRALHARWTAALCDREREARTLAEELSDLSCALRRAAAAYADTDDTVARRVRRSGP